MAVCPPEPMRPPMPRKRSLSAPPRRASTPKPSARVAPHLQMTPIEWPLPPHHVPRSAAYRPLTSPPRPPRPVRRPLSAYALPCAYCAVAVAASLFGVAALLQQWRQAPDRPLAPSHAAQGARAARKAAAMLAVTPLIGMVGAFVGLDLLVHWPIRSWSSAPDPQRGRVSVSRQRRSRACARVVEQ